MTEMLVGFAIIAFAVVCFSVLTAAAFCHVDKEV